MADSSVVSAPEKGVFGMRMRELTLQADPQVSFWKSLSEDVYQVVYKGQRGQFTKTNIFLAH